MAFNFKLPFSKKTATSATEKPRSALLAPSSQSRWLAPLLARRLKLPLIGDKTTAQQLEILGILFLVLLGVLSVALWNSVREAGYSANYVSASSQLRILTLQIAKSTPLALQGKPEALKELGAARDQFNTLVEALKNGGAVGNGTVPGTPDSVRPVLIPVIELWAKADKNLTMLRAQEKSILKLGKAVTTINQKNPALLKHAEEAAALKLEANNGTRTPEINATNQLVMLTQRIAKNANALAGVDNIGPETTEQLVKDTATFHELLVALQQGNNAMRISPAIDADTGTRLANLDAMFLTQQEAFDDVLSNLPQLLATKKAGAAILQENPALLNATEELFNAYSNQDGGSLASNATATGTGVLALIIMLLMAKLFNDETALRAEEAERQRQKAEQQRRDAEANQAMTQEAILRLLNEMGDLADGDLTVRATVSEDVTGAIADAVNYTTEELAVLVKRINDTATRVAAASAVAQQISHELLGATQQQSQEITTAGNSVVRMAQSMDVISARALESAQVARNALEAAQKGSNAVTDSIKGMNEIREQIQETSKRIKRLGESSQEIGEIVELISDITEQTNVLALNAAIQAASAGEAGRGFTVVAEEVQRLAERSGEATKQIAAIVKTIQTDTHDAVSAMENSTRDVVAGARLSDAAGQALKEISSVSDRLAHLIETFSSDAQLQADSATQVAEKMKTILQITEQTTTSTQQTALSVGDLANLAVELKGSVAGFKV